MASKRVQPQGAPTHQLVIKDVFERLSDREKLYAHHLSRAAWYGARVIMSQTSPEANSIFDLIIELYRSCAGQWSRLIEDGNVTEEEMSAFLDYAGLFLSNIGNYFADGGKKIIPNLSKDALHKLAASSPLALSLLEEVGESMLSSTPSSIGYPGDNTQASYYLGDKVTRDELALISNAMEAHSIEPENTRILKKQAGQSRHVFDVLQASAVLGCLAIWDSVDDLGTVIRVCGGDHREAMSKVSGALLQAKNFVGNDKQSQIIDHCITSFLTGSLGAFRESQKLWVTDKSPVIESIFGFIEPYRDPHGVRGEWEAIVCISDPVESLSLKQLVEKSDFFIRKLPWAVPGINVGKGPFEKELFEAPDFASVHALTSCSSIVWNGINLPNYHDIRENCGSKNVVVANRVAAENDRASPCHYVDNQEIERFKDCMPSISNITTAVHELFGHGTGKLLSETGPGVYNFDKSDLPVSPITGKPVETWYRPGQTWTSVFGEIAGAVEECRAEVMSMYLIDNKELLALFGHDDKTPITVDEIVYNTYLAIGVAGLQALDFFNADEQAWGEPHRSGQFAIFKHLLRDAGGVMAIEHDEVTGNLTVKVDREKILTHGKPALGRLLCQLQIWRCTADVKPCAELYEDLSAVKGVYEDWRKIVSSKPEPRWKFVQPNTFLCEGSVELKVYDESNEGIIQSWAEREV